MAKISVVILTKNSEATIEKAISSAFLISDDVWVVDSGSEDATLTIASKLNARILHINWQGYGAARNTGAKEALHNMIFCLDSDEEITTELAQNIKALQPKPYVLYGCKRINFLGHKKILHGEWGNDYVYRLYNRNDTFWNLDTVHETLEDKGFQRKQISGILNHYTSPGIEDYNKKLLHYAVLGGKKYFDNNKQPSVFKLHFSPAFNFLKNYIFKSGFLDGKEGWQIAKAHYRYTKEKYRQLKQLQKHQ